MVLQIILAVASVVLLVGVLSIQMARFGFAQDRQPNQLAWILAIGAGAIGAAALVLGLASFNRHEALAGPDHSATYNLGPYQAQIQSPGDASMYDADTKQLAVSYNVLDKKGACVRRAVQSKFQVVASAFDVSPMILNDTDPSSCVVQVAWTITPKHPGRHLVLMNFIVQSPRQRPLALVLPAVHMEVVTKPSVDNFAGYIIAVIGALGAIVAARVGKP